MNNTTKNILLVLIIVLVICLLLDAQFKKLKGTIELNTEATNLLSTVVYASLLVEKSIINQNQFVIENINGNGHVFGDHNILKIENE